MGVQVRPPPHTHTHKSEPNENTCGDVLECYLAVANMAIRFPQAVKPLGEPLVLLEIRIQLSNELADWQTLFAGSQPAADTGDFIPDWDSEGEEDGPANNKAKHCLLYTSDAADE